MLTGISFHRWIRLIGVFFLISTLAVATASAQTPDPAQEDGSETPSSSLGSNTFRIFAHPEGLVGYTTANGHVIQPNDFFVALPCFCVLSSQGGNEFEVLIEYEGNSLVLPVWDVGPWNIEDNYWDPPEERTWKGLPRGLPQAEAAFFDDYNGGLDGWDRTILSPAGMDIADGAFYALGMTDSDWVTVTFLWLEEDHESVVPELPSLPTAYQDIGTYWWDERPPLDPADPVSDPRYNYVVETQHNVPSEIYNYWIHHGGWRTLGLPVSEFHRSVLDDGSIRLMQYFERSILTVEWFDDGSWVVSAEPLGYQTYIDPAADEPIEPFEPDNWAVYFPETGHSLGGGFRVFWETYGGYEVFGAPLSEEWGTTTSDGRQVVMQVFEKARMEWWPDKVGTDEDITLGLLTLEMLLRVGWIEPAPE